ncbi:Cap15 family cyclic dinucleotide receptor domain-containing protein [Vagococcus elongatus]|uniref:CD-NTase-associated protein 15 domain-containing protein n=1 Tax=Vagococcus elongatus TaxID=180344 RepID=A0A430AT94_9ENTE|nr:hypothetical protein [Vagococcus elongatus]RSU11289.1 hypothetical protein CBF29_08260 [Vagococcus elongatus]
MKSRINNLLKWAGIISAIIFLALKYFKGAENIWDYGGLAGEAAGYSSILVLLYEKWIWRYNPLIKIPKLKKEYSGLLKYNYDNIPGEKDIDIIISQTLTNINIIIKTDEIISNSITSELIEENNQYVLYYTYLTQPKSQFSDKNPMQYGSSKLCIDNEDEFHGIYWTTRETKGDIYFKSI